jgi:hypothetical protein
MIRIALALVLIAHGIGHSMGLLQVFKVATVNPSWNGESWLLSGITGTPVAQAVGVALWSVAMVGFIVLGGVVLGIAPSAWWEPLALASAMASLLAVLLFPLAFPTVSTLGALVVDLLVILAAGWYHWVPANLAS